LFLIIFLSHVGTMHVYSAFSLMITNEQLELGM